MATPFDFANTSFASPQTTPGPSPSPYGQGWKMPEGWEVDPTRVGGVRPWDPRENFNPTAGGGAGSFYRPINWQQYGPGGSLYPGNKTPPPANGIGLPAQPGIGLPTDPMKPFSKGADVPFTGGYTTNAVGGSAAPDLGAQTPFQVATGVAGTPTAGSTALPYYNNTTGQEIGQYYGVQLAPGQVGFGAGTPGVGTTPTTPTNPTTPVSTGPGALMGATPEGRAQRMRDYEAAHGTHEQQIFNNTQVGQGPWDSGMSITSPQDWQNFRFSGDNLSQWQKNANMIQNPLDRFRYMFSGSTGGATGHNESKMAMIRAGIDPQVANRLADVFMGNSEGANYAASLGIGGNTTNRTQNVFQLGNQLWGVRPGVNGGPNQRFLIQDFGGNNWESGSQIDRNRPNGATGNQDLMNWYRQYEKDNPAQFFRNSNQTNVNTTNQTTTPVTNNTVERVEQSPVTQANKGYRNNRGIRTKGPYRVARTYAQ